jgi:hypothetical protein
MTQTPKKQDKPSDPPYSGGEDETTNRKSKPGSTEPPVDETDDGPGAAANDTGEDS